MEPIATLPTARLIGAPPRPEDAADLRRLHGDARVMATLAADGRPLDEAATHDWLRRRREHWARHGYGAWLFRDRGDGRFVGYAGLATVIVDGEAAVELGYAVCAGEWGRGLATEMGAAVLATGFGRLGLPAVVAYTLPANRASRRVMEKLGLQYEREIVHAGLAHVLYRLGAADWRRRHEVTD